MENLKIIVAENIVKLRKKIQLTQLDLAERLNYSDKAVSKWERGEALPDLETLKKIADMFGVTLDFLVKEHKEDKKKFVLPKIKAHNHLIISVLAFLGVWFIATAVFSLLEIFLEDKEGLWKIFIYAIPASVACLVVFNAIWGRFEYGLILISILVWSILLGVYIGLLEYNIWPIFLIGVPAQLILIFWSRLKTIKWFVKRN